MALGDGLLDQITLRISLEVLPEAVGMQQLHHDHVTFWPSTKFGGFYFTLKTALGDGLLDQITLKISLEVLSEAIGLQ